MSNLLPIISGVEFEQINGAEWDILFEDVVCGRIYAEHYDADGYAYDTFDINGMNAEDLTWTVYNYISECKYINPTATELKEAILKAI